MNEIETGGYKPLLVRSSVHARLFERAKQLKELRNLSRNPSMSALLDELLDATQDDDELQPQAAAQ